jgi:hypothetical protein
MFGAAILAVIGVLLLIESALLSNADSPTDIAYLRAIHEALMGIGFLLIAIFAALIVMILPDKPRLSLGDLR